MAERKRKYEAFYIVRPELGDGEIKAIAEKFKGVVEKEGGEVSEAGLWDKRKLAYEVNGLKEGNYILMNFEASSQVPKELDRQMRISDDVVRHRIFLQED